MTSRVRGAVGVTILLLAALTYAAIMSGRPPVPRRDVFTQDSLRATAPVFDRDTVRLVTRETLYVHVAERAVQHADTLVHVADSLALRGDSLLRVVHDTAAAALTYRQEADSLRHAVTVEHDAYEAEHRARLSADLHVVEVNNRLTATEHLNTRLSDDLAHAGSCHVLPFIPCPSRKMSFLAGGLIVGGAIIAHDKHIL